jgi:methyl-accepting chemotaxis protein
MLVRMRIGHKLTLALAALLLTTVAVAAVGITSLSDVNRRAQALYNDNVRTTEATSALWSALYEAEETAFRLLILPDGEQRSELEEELEEETGLAIEQGLVELRQVHAGDPPDELARVERLAEAWARFERLWQSGALDPGSAAPRRVTAARVAATLEPATELAAELAAIEAEEAQESQAHAQSTYRQASVRIVLLSAVAVLVCLLIALALVHNLVPRLRSYSSFAGRVADGQLGERLNPRGGDEVADLGRALDLMVGRRERQRDYQEAQAEFADTMQLSEGEAEAHELLKRHLERTLDGSRVTVLNRNNSADRLEAATAVDPHCPLHDTLQGPSPVPAWPSASGGSTGVAWSASRCCAARSAASCPTPPPASRCSSAAR